MASPQNQEQHGSNATASEKHKLDEGAPNSPARKSRKTNDDGKEQQTIEQTLNGKKDDVESTPKQEEQDDTKNDDIKPDNTTPDDPSATKPEDSAVEDHARNGSTPSNVLEKGIIYFFFRGRVGIDSPSGAQDLQRTYFILRPIPKDASLGSGAIGDSGNSRLCAIPKKALPTDGKEKWICFVEKAGVSFDTLKEEFLNSEDYTTKTVGPRHTPAATPVGEGVYAITTTGRESHLTYILTLPNEIGEVQKEIGLRKQGSMALSTKNPETPSPQGAQFPEGPKFSKEILGEFNGLRWLGTQPKHLDVVNTQFLLIGESDSDAALQPEKKDEDAKDKVVPKEEIEKLEEEDEERMKALGKDESAAIFSDLEVRAKDYPKLKTTF